jgi:transposase
MGYRYEISDVEWNRIKALLPGQPGQHGGIAEDNRGFINAVLWIARTGAAWRDLPARLGNWNSQWRRFDRWAAKGRFATIVAELRDPDLEVLMLDSTVIRAHPCAAGAKKNGTAAAEKRTKPWVTIGADSAQRFTGVSMASGIPSC